MIMTGRGRTLTMIWLVLLALWPVAAPAQDAELALSVDRQELGIAERLRMTLTVTAPTAALVAFPDVAAELEHFSVVTENRASPAAMEDGRQIWRQAYVLAPRQAGETIIPPLTAVVQQTTGDASLRQRELRSETIPVNVITLVPADAAITALRDVAPPVDLSTPMRLTPAWWLAGAVLLLALSGLWLRRRRQPPRQRSQPAHELALAALRTLDPDDQAQVDRFYVRLSDILRRYVLWRFGLEAPRRTTDETLTAMDQAGEMLAQRSEHIGLLLRDFDQVKFGRHRPQGPDMQRALGEVTAFVEATADRNVTVKPSMRPEAP